MSDDAECCSDGCKETNIADIQQVEGYKDDKKISIKFEEPTEAFNPKMDHMMTMVEYLYEAEDAAFPDGYGRQMPMFYFILLALGQEDSVHNAVGTEGWHAKQTFEDLVDEHADEAIWTLKRLRGDAREDG
jgi:hypothetical protein